MIEIKFNADTSKYFFNFNKKMFYIHSDFIDKRYKKKIVCKYPFYPCCLYQSEDDIYIDVVKDNMKSYYLCFLNIKSERNVRNIYDCNCIVRFQEKYLNSDGYIYSDLIVLYTNETDLKKLIEKYGYIKIENI